MTIGDDHIPLLFAILTFMVICLLSMGVSIHLRSIRNRREMLKKVGAGGGWEGIETDASPLNLSGEQDGAFLNFFRTVGVKTQKGKSADDENIKLKFLRAGLRNKDFPSIFWGVKFLLMTVLPIAFFAFAVLVVKTMNSSQMLSIAVALALAGLVLPDMWLRMKTSKRRETMSKAFPDALDLLVVCVEAGMGLDAALRRVGEEMELRQPELSEEFKLLNLELRAGKPRQVALKNLAARTDMEDVGSLITMLIQTDRFGTSVAQALRVFSEGFRTTRYQRAEEQAEKLGVKLLFPLVFFIFPAFLVVSLGPSLIIMYRVFRHGM